MKLLGQTHSQASSGRGVRGGYHNTWGGEGVRPAPRRAFRVAGATAGNAPRTGRLPAPAEAEQNGERAALDVTGLRRTEIAQSQVVPQFDAGLTELHTAADHEAVFDPLGLIVE